MSSQQPQPGYVVASGALVNPGGAQGPGGSAGDSAMVGDIKMWPGSSAPVGWMNCDGSLISRATYPALFSLIGTTFSAGDGATTFGLPDLRSRVPLCAGQGASLSLRAIGQSGGEELHVLSVAELAAHAHALGGHTHGMDHYHNWNAQGSHNHADNGHTHPLPGQTLAGGSGIASGTGYGIAGNATSTGYASIAAAATPAGNTVYASQTNGAWVNTGGPSAGSNNAGSDAGHNNMPPYLVVNFVIKVSATVPMAGPSAPLADSTQSGLLRQVNGLTTSFVDGTNNCQDLAGAISTLAVRSYNSVGNPTFEIDARTAGAGNAGSGWALDRWTTTVNGAGAGTFKQTAGQVILAGTSFCVSGSFLRFNLTTQKATLAATDYIYVEQLVEGVRLRELLGGLTAATIVCRSSVAPISFAFFIRDTTSAYSLCKLYTISNASAWTLITLPNIATWTASGNFPSTPGVVGCTLGVTIACGATLTPPTNDVWNAGNFIGAVGMSNFAAQPVNSTFDLGFIQHTPGGTAPAILDKEWQTNYDECLRYFQKTYAYTQKPGAINTAGYHASWQPTANPNVFGPISFFKPMAKIPTVVPYSQIDGLPNAYTYNGGATGTAVTSMSGVSDSGYSGFVSGGAPAANWWAFWQHTVDTGW